MKLRIILIRRIFIESAIKKLAQLPKQLINLYKK